MYYLYDILESNDFLCKEMQRENFNFNTFYTIYKTYMDDIQINFIDGQGFGDAYHKFRCQVESGGYFKDSIVYLPEANELTKIEESLK